MTSAEMDASERWIQDSFSAQIPNARLLFWPLWAQCFTLRVPAEECTMIISWPATGFMMYFITDHTSVSRNCTENKKTFIFHCWKQSTSMHFFSVMSWQSSSEPLKPPKIDESEQNLTLYNGKFSGRL